MIVAFKLSPKGDLQLRSVQLHEVSWFQFPVRLHDCRAICLITQVLTPWAYSTDCADAIFVLRLPAFNLCDRLCVTLTRLRTDAILATLTLDQPKDMVVENGSTLSILCQGRGSGAIAIGGQSSVKQAIRRDKSMFHYKPLGSDSTSKRGEWKTVFGSYKEETISEVLFSRPSLQPTFHTMSCPQTTSRVFSDLPLSSHTDPSSTTYSSGSFESFTIVWQTTCFSTWWLHVLTQLYY